MGRGWCGQAAEDVTAPHASDGLAGLLDPSLPVGPDAQRICSVDASDDHCRPCSSSSMFWMQLSSFTRSVSSGSACNTEKTRKKLRTDILKLIHKDTDVQVDDVLFTDIAIQ